MADEPYVGEIRIFCGNFAPAGWMLCQGQLLAISENETLFQLIGTTYGGDGQSTFALPNLASRVPIHQGTGPGGVPFVIGQSAGAEAVTLTAQQIPQHTHVPQALAGPGTNPSPAGGIWAESTLTQFSASAPSVAMNASAIQSTGGSQPHENMIPVLCVNFIISLFGVFPSQN